MLGAWQLDQCLSDAGVFENKVSLSGAPWEVRLASRLLHERHASHLLTVLLTHLLFWCIVVYEPTFHSQLTWFAAMKVEGFCFSLTSFSQKSECWGFHWHLAQVLHRSKGSDSEWAAYINVLPQFVFLPLFFTDLVPSEYFLTGSLQSIVWLCYHNLSSCHSFSQIWYHQNTSWLVHDHLSCNDDCNCFVILFYSLVARN